MGLAADLIALALFLPIGYMVAEGCLRLAYRRADTWPPTGLERFDAVNLTGEEIGYMANFETGAIQAAVARLRVAEAVTYDPDTGLLQPTGTSVIEPTELSTAVLAAVTDGQRIDELRRDAEVQQALEDLHERLFSVRPSYRMPPPWYFLVAGIPLVVLGIVGVGWALIPPFRWYTDIPLILLAIGAAMLPLQARSWAFALPAGGLWPRLLTRIKERNGHLDPAMNPALRTYGPAVSAVAVGLFGLGVLSSVDPALALAMPPVPDEPQTTPVHATATDEQGGRAAFGPGCALPPPDSGSGCGGGCGGCGG